MGTSWTITVFLMGHMEHTWEHAPSEYLIVIWSWIDHDVNNHPLFRSSNTFSGIYQFAFHSLAHAGLSPEFPYDHDHSWCQYLFRQRPRGLRQQTEKFASVSGISLTVIKSYNMWHLCDNMQRTHGNSMEFRAKTGGNPVTLHRSNIDNTWHRQHLVPLAEDVFKLQVDLRSGNRSAMDGLVAQGPRQCGSVCYGKNEAFWAVGLKKCCFHKTLLWHYGLWVMGFPRCLMGYEVVDSIVCRCLQRIPANKSEEEHTLTEEGTNVRRKFITLSHYHWFFQRLWRQQNNSHES